MRIGFTLLELMVVIIIIGVLATIGLTQYQTVTERSRGAEARQILGALRSQCAAFYIADNDATDCTTENLGVGTEADQVPSACRSSHYFSYAVTEGASSVTFTATRCNAGRQGARCTSSRSLPKFDHRLCSRGDRHLG
jgi:prepilin-type N-terminal cleavage/methylation domain-containing protein